MGNCRWVQLYTEAQINGDLTPYLTYESNQYILVWFGFSLGLDHGLGLNLGLGLGLGHGFGFGLCLVFPLFMVLVLVFILVVLILVLVLVTALVLVKVFISLLWKCLFKIQRFYALCSAVGLIYSDNFEFHYHFTHYFLKLPVISTKLILVVGQFFVDSIIVLRFVVRILRQTWHKSFECS